MTALVSNTLALKWLPEHDELLKRLHNEGYSGGQAAVEINREFRTSYSRNAVIGRKSRIGLTVPARRDKVERHRSPMAKAKAKAPRPDTPFHLPRPLPAAEIIAIRCSQIVPRNLVLVDLRSDSCRWPYGDREVTYCGHPRTDGSSYCLDHFHLSRRRVA